MSCRAAAEQPWGIGGQKRLTFLVVRRGHNLGAHLDTKLNLFGNGQKRFSVPLQAIEIAREGAEVTSVVQYDQVFRHQSDLGPPPVPSPNLFASQEDVYASCMALGCLGEGGRPGVLRRAWGVRRQVAEVRDVSFHRFFARQEKWDSLLGYRSRGPATTAPPAASMPPSRC